MRAVVLVTNAFGGRGGIAKVNRDLISALSTHRGMDEVVVVPRVVDFPAGDPPPRVNLRSRASRGVARYASEIARLISSPRGIDLVVCGHVNLAPLAGFIGRLRRAPRVLVIHGVEAWFPSARRLVAPSLARMDAVIAVSRFTLDRFNRWSPAARRAEFVVPNTVALDQFAPGPKPRDLLDRWGLGGKTVLLTLGRLDTLERAKGFDQVLELLPELGREIPDVAYVIAGEGSDRTRLEAKARELGVADRVVFTGEVEEARKADVFRLADAYVMPSRLEGFGIVYLEALASGVPVVGGAFDGSRAALLDGRLGELVDPDDPADIARGIRAALARPHGLVPPELERFAPGAYEARIHEIVDTLFGVRKAG